MHAKTLLAQVKCARPVHQWKLSGQILYYTTRKEFFFFCKINSYLHSCMQLNLVWAHSGRKWNWIGKILEIALPSNEPHLTGKIMLASWKTLNWGSTVIPTRPTDRLCLFSLSLWISCEGSLTHLNFACLTLRINYDLELTACARIESTRQPSVLTRMWRKLWMLWK